MAPGAEFDADLERQFGTGSTTIISLADHRT